MQEQNQVYIFPHINQQPEVLGAGELHLLMKHTIVLISIFRINVSNKFIFNETILIDIKPQDTHCPP